MEWTKIRVYIFVVFVLLSISSMGYRYIAENKPVYLGIDFAGGTRIPILLEKPVDSDTMEQIVETIKKRTSAYALTEVKVRSLGSDEIVVELPTSKEEYILKVEELLSSRGVFKAVIDGQVALLGDEIYQGTITDETANIRQMEGGGAGFWAVGFSVTSKGADMMKDAVLGKPNYAVYMFLDRPSNAVILIPQEALTQNIDELKSRTKNAPVTINNELLLDTLRDSMKLEGDDIDVYILEDKETYDSLVSKDNSTKMIVPDTIDTGLENDLRSRGFRIVKFGYQDFVPSYMPNLVKGFVADQWAVAGLMNAPGIDERMTYGAVGYTYTIRGEEKGDNIAEASEMAYQQKKKIMSILKGGALPVQISLGSKTIIPAPLGGRFLEMSVLGAVTAIFVISLFVGFRYRQPKVILGILLAGLGEVIILVGIIGSFSIDLGAMAGILAAIGISVDSEVVITDELLSKTGTLKDRINRAFQIVMTTGGISVVTMMPLLFSGLTEIVGFAISTMTGTLIGMLISRHAYVEYLKKVVLKQE